MKTPTITLLLSFFCFLSYGSLLAQGEFITTWKTDNPGKTDAKSIEIPIGEGIFNYTVDWGDGYSTSHRGAAKHTYSRAGIYIVKISGDFPHIKFSLHSDSKKLLSVEQWGNQVWDSMEKSFYKCSNVVINAADAPNLSKVSSMRGMFDGARSLNQDIGHWDVSGVTDMGHMFSSAVRFNKDIGSWDVGKVRDMSFMFHGAKSFNQDISGWDVSRTNKMEMMFMNSRLSTANYDKLLKGWSMLDLRRGVSFFVGETTFCEGTTARQLIMDKFGWSIIDAGKDCLAEPYTTTYKIGKPRPGNASPITIRKRFL